MTDIQEHETMWFPEIYGGRKGVYAQPLCEMLSNPPQPEEILKLVELVATRAKEDGEWAIENGFVGDNEDTMRKMMAWVSRPDNIEQCAQGVFRDEMEHECTVDWVCRDLANASKNIMGTRG
jgi:hypothetical protein